MSPRASAPKPVHHRQRGLQTRSEIVAAAERHFAESGYEATRLDDVAADVGIRRAAIFYHFGGKQELYTAVLDGVFADWTEALPSEGSAAERLEAALTGWIDYIARRPTVARLILREAASAQPGESTDFVRAGGPPVEWFAGVIDEGVKSGELKPLIEPRKFMSLMGAITVFHSFAAMPWLSVGRASDSGSEEELEKHKHDILLVARHMLGIDTTTASD